MDSQSPLPTAPVAEYLGVCILERGGNVKKVWEGQSYTTDGFTYICKKEESGKVTLVKFSTERLAKEYIDGLQNRQDYYSMREFWKNILREPVPVVQRYEWDDIGGRFIATSRTQDGIQRRQDMRSFYGKRTG